jgi:hypothetical protein
MTLAEKVIREESIQQLARLGIPTKNTGCYEFFCHVGTPPKKFNLYNAHHYSTNFLILSNSNWMEAARTLGGGQLSATSFQLPEKIKAKIFTIEDTERRKKKSIPEKQRDRGAEGYINDENDMYS